MILALTGYAGSGKDTIAEQLLDDYGFGRVAFADKLKELAWAINPIIAAEEEKDPIIGACGVYNAPVAVTLQEAYYAYGFTCEHSIVERVDIVKSECREFLQSLGSAMRDEVSPMFWINQALQSMESLREDGFEHIVVTDVRYLNERSALQSWAGGAGEEFVLAYVVRPGVGPRNGHESERNVEALAARADLTITNDGAPSEVVARARRILQKYI